MNPNWRQLQSLSASKPVQSSAFWVAFVPVIARLLQGVESVVSVEMLSQQFTLHLALPFSWKVLFFAAVAFLAANLVVAIWCPQVIRQTKNYTDFVDQKRSVSELEELLLYVKQANRLTEAALGSVMNDINRYRRYMTQQTATGNYDAISREQVEPGLADVYFRLVNAMSVSNPILRGVAASLYGLGFLGVGIVFIQSVKFVVAQI